MALGLMYLCPVHARQTETLPEKRQLHTPQLHGAKHEQEKMVVVQAPDAMRSCGLRPER